MRLKSISYKDDNWELENLELGLVNLIVGRNGAGKTSSLNFIETFVKATLDRLETKSNRFTINTEFVNENSDSIFYNIKAELILDKIGTKFSEILNRNNYELLYRNGKTPTLIYNELTQAKENIYPPNDKLVVAINRDIKKYPYIEEINDWVNNTFGFQFGVLQNKFSPGYLNEEHYSLNKVQDVTLLFEILTDESKKKIIDELNNLNYNIKQIEVNKGWRFPNGSNVLMITEEHYDKRLSWFAHPGLSQGTFRTLSILIFLEYLISQKQPACIVIDDFCEGLDYDRATKLGKLVFKKCEENNIQLIATTNDKFLMDVVDIEHWSILYREGNVVKSINKVSHPEVFEDFLYSGLSNFYFFTSDFIAQNI